MKGESHDMDPRYTATHSENHGIVKVEVPTWEPQGAREKPCVSFTVTYSFMSIPSDPFPVRMRMEGAEISLKRSIINNLISALRYCIFAAEHVEKNKTHPRSFDEFLRDKTWGRRIMPTIEEAEEILKDLIENF